MNPNLPGMNWRNYVTTLAWSGRIKGKMNAFLNRPYQVETEMGLFDCVDRHSITQLFPFYEPEMQWALNRYGHPGGFFLDVGASIGVHSVRASQLGMRATAIEPTLSVFLCLQSNFKRLVKEGLPLNVAAWSSDCKMTLHTTIDSERNTLYQKDVAGVKGKPLYEVLAFRLDGLLRGEIPDLIKLDVEGAELEAMKGLENTLKAKKSNVVFEAFEPSKLEGCTAYLKTLSYRVMPISGWNYLGIPD